ncbi:sugar ABC transporter ATP-binding protein [Cellulomonas hominis]|uniref:Erythritol transport system ATP-binding protein n=1 Tax=Cellulomonas hominis TaxID=156981 RepID=A0A511FC12_9CELL|nr:sugar ABC transporter ATP-binding protein [Cellulomonas hominis]MBB5473367.1 erythritol transport system ATP-binding protein [Cellulomonas hominis]NKY06939.1 sugar ABC transporter ATP-binding protein [Cellulomonas hominis]GEL45348.1 sugar ABC transporter ATP-binding protein [Cellulomonas hominis]
MTEAPALPDVVLRATGVAKVYGGTHALRGVDFEVRRGHVTALLGENGAGKSTLMKILAGVEKPTTGTIELDGAPVEFASPADAVAHGVAIIHQELNLCPNLSISDNIFIGRERVKGAFVDFPAQRAAARELLEHLEEPLDPTTLVGDLRLGQQQLVEIARALAEDTRVLIIDEPTSALSAAEVHVLFRVIRELTARGVSIIYISHHLDECLEIADTAVVLRDGALVAQAPMADVDLGWIVSQMVGREEGALFAPMAHDPGAPLLEIDDLIVSDPDAPERLAVRGVSLTVHAGEVVGVYGLMGAGRTELLEALAGRNPVLGGRVTLDGEDLTHATVGDRIDAGLVLVPEDRQRDGLVQALSVGRNMALAAVDRFVRGPFVRGRDERGAVEDVSRLVRVKTAGQDAPIGSLSGGNQQKVVIGRALMTKPKLLVLDEPTRGIDVGAKADIFALMADEARKGIGVLFATSEVGEVLHACDRILVMARGRIAAELDPRTTDREQLMAASDVTVPDDAAGATARTDPDAPTLPEAPTTTTEDE